MRYITFILLGILLAGCGPTQNDTSIAKDSTAELVLWVSYQGAEVDVFKKLVKRFEDKCLEERGIKVKISPKQVPFDDLVTSLKMASLSKKLPDIVRVDVQKVTDLAYHKVLVKLDTLPNFKTDTVTTIEDKAKLYMPGAFYANVVETRGKDGKFETHLYGLPEQISCLGLFWNRRMFQLAGQELRAAGLDPNRAPRTWDELVEYARVLKRKIPKPGGKEGEYEQVYGFAMRNSLWWTVPFFNLYNVEFVTVDSNGKKISTLGDEKTCAALQLKVDLYRKHQIEAGAWTSGAIADDTGFTNEKYAMILMGAWNIQTFENKGLDFGVALVPTISEKEAKRLNIPVPVSASNVGGNSMVITETCKHKELAYEFINFMADWEQQLDWCLELKQTPVNQKAAQILMGEIPHPKNPDFKVDINEKIKLFMEQVKYTKNVIQLPRYDFIESDVFNTQMELALSGKKTVKQALEDAGKKLTENILIYVNE